MSTSAVPGKVASRGPGAPATANGRTHRGEDGQTLEASLVATVAPVMRHLVAHARRRRTWSELTYQQYNVLRIIDTLEDNDDVQKVYTNLDPASVPAEA